MGLVFLLSLFMEIQEHINNCSGKNSQGIHNEIAEKGGKAKHIAYIPS